MASSTLEESKLPGGYLVTPRVPQGLAAAVEGLTREVIRHSPEDIYVFAAHHFEKLLLIRERCGPEEMAPNRDSNFQTLREMNQALRMREFERVNARSTRNPSDQVGWSLNQTAKVLKRHRSIFGDAGRRISTDEVFQMANQKENHAQPSAEKNQRRASLQKREGPRPPEKPSSQTSDELWKASTSRTDRSWSNEDSPEVSEPRSGPRMITQIPSLQSSTTLLAKDIKSELRKNRISSRERRNVRANPEDRSSVERSDVRGPGKPSGRNVVPRKSSERLKRTEPEVEKRNRRSVESTRSSKGRQGSEKTTDSRAMSMDRVKDYVVQRFATTKSLEELQDVNYVEKVQEIIDETGPIIKGKVEELKSGMIGRSKRSSWFSEPRNDRAKGSNGSGSEDRSSAGHSSHKDSVESSEALRQSADALRFRLNETQHLLENVSSKMARPRRSRSARSSRRSATGEDVVADRDFGEEATVFNNETLNRDNGLERRLSKTKNLLEDISSALSGPMRRSSSAKSLRRREDDDLGDLGSRDALKMRLDETRNLLEGISASFAMPGHRVGSSKGRRRRRAVGNVVNDEMSLSDSQNMPKVSLPAVRSASAKSSSGSVSRSDSDHLVLPAISPEAPKSKKVREDLVLPALSPPGTGSSNDGSKIGEDDVFDEEDIPELPVEDYIPEAIVEDVFRDSLNVTPDFDKIPLRPDSLEPPETVEDAEATTKSDNLEERLQEIQKVEKDIEKVFTLKSSNDTLPSGELEESGMKKKLRELEEAEKRIERIFDGEVSKGTEDSPKSEMHVDASGDDVDDVDGSGRNVEEEIVTERKTARGSEGNDEEEDEEMKGDKQGSTNLLTTSPEPLNYTYVLTEGSPYEIPDTVTTVIIPERNVESPESDRLDVVLEDGEDVKLTLVPGDGVRKESNEVVKIHENVAEEVEGEISKHVDMQTEVSSQPELKSSTDDNTKKQSPSMSPKNGSNEDDSSLKKDADPFGELVEPEPMEFTSPDIDFIRGIESRQEMHISHQDLGRINEEMSEELEEGLEEAENTPKSPDGHIIQKGEEDDEDKKAEKAEAVEEIQKRSDGSVPEEKTENDDIKNAEIVETIGTPEIIEAMKETEEEVAESSDRSVVQKDEEDDEDKELETDETAQTPEAIEAIATKHEEDAEEDVTSPIIHPRKEDNEIQTSDVDKPKTKTESELSPFRQDLDSSSSNEAKESSGPDEPLESGKCANSADEEESSDTRSPESSNEVKETTLTDGLSLSLDPTRPFVPELNLDSLQDITVSSFKMTEDEYENQGHAESANTNSITETLTSDENHRIIESDLPEEAVMEYLVSSSDRSKMNEAEVGQVEVAEEPIVKSQVEIKEDICVKNSAYVTGPDNENDNLVEGQRESQAEEKEESGKSHSAKSSTRDKKEEIEKEDEVEEKSSTEPDEIENLAVEKSVHEEHEDIAKVSAEDEKEEITEEIETEHKSPTEQDKVDLVAEDVQREKVSEQKEDSVKSPTVEEKEEIQEEIDVEYKSPSEMEKIETEENKKRELSATEYKEDGSTEEKSDAESATSEVKKNEEIKEDDIRSSESAIIEDAEVVDHKMEDQTTKSTDSSREVESVEKVENRHVSEEETDRKNSADSQEEKRTELPPSEEKDGGSTEEKSDAESATSEVKKNEEIKEDDSGSSKSPIVEDSEVVDHKMEDQTTKSTDSSREVESVEKVENRHVSEEETDRKNSADSQEEKRTELPPSEEKDGGSTEEKSDAESATSEVKKNEEIKEDDSGSSKSPIVEDSEVVDHKMDDQTTKSTDSSREVESVEKVENRHVSEEETDRKNSADSQEEKRTELPASEEKDGGSTEEKSDAQSATSEVKKNEEIKEDDSGSPQSPIVEGSEVVDHKMDDQTTKSADLSCEIKSVEEGSDEMLEESFVEEDTPLAVSRSASQCTTRRVSSGNLARLREDPTLGWTEESEREIGNEEEGSSSKLKFSKIGGETIKEQGSDEIDLSQNSGSPKNLSDDANGSVTKDSREYHIYVPEVDASEDYSTTESSTVDSAVTKIQARVRGFLTRRRMHRGQHNRSSTLSSIPSIQDSIVGEPYNIEGHQPEAESQTTEPAEKANISSSLTLDEPGLENAATRIQSNYRGYKARKRLRREDAVQRTTLSLEKSFAESGLQHTGEFHDCIPLPLHDIAPKKKSPNAKDSKFDPTPQKTFSSSLEAKEIISGSKNISEVQKGHETSEDNLEDHQNHGQMFFGQSSNVPVIQFGMMPNIGHLVDLVVLAKEESALESSYLNFITSVEDTEVVDSSPEIKTSGKSFTDLNVVGDMLKRPPVFSEPPVGVIIEEITSSEIESFLNDHPPGSEVKGPEVTTESSGSAKAPCASSETISDSLGDSKIEEIGPEGQITEETPEGRKFPGGHEEHLVRSEEKMVKDFGIPASLSSSQEKDFLGPESSVDSMECPVVGSEEKNSSRSSGENGGALKIKREVGECSEEEKIIGVQGDSSSGSDVIKENTKEEEPFVSNVDDASSTLSFSLKVEDFLGLGSEESMELHRRKPILEVTLTPGDIMKSMSLSQESQLAGERIESPITMVQMAPARSESLQLEEPSESGCDDEGNSGKAVSPSAEQSGQK